MPEYNVSKLKLPNGVILNLPGGSSYDQLNTSEIDGVDYDYMSQDGMVVSPQDLAYLISYVSGNMLGDPLPDNANLNNYAGFDYEFRSYYTDNANNTISNVPTNISTNVALTRKFKLICSHINTGNYMQIIIPTDAVDNSVLSNPPLTSLFYIRFKISSTWTSWKEIGNFWWLTTIDSLEWGSDTHFGQSQGRQLTISLLPETNGSPVEDTQGMVYNFYIPFGDSSSSGLVRASSEAVISIPSPTDQTASHTVPTQLGLYRSLRNVGNAATTSDFGIVKLTDVAATDGTIPGPSGVSDHIATTPLCVNKSIHSSSNAMPDATATAGTDDSTAYVITASGLKKAIQKHDHLTTFSTTSISLNPAETYLVLENTINYYSRNSSGKPGTQDSSISSTGTIDIPVASASTPGVVRLSASTSSTSGTSDGYAATPSAVKSAYDAATTNANSSTYGRVKLSASTSSSYGTSDGYAATPSAVRSAYNLADSAYDLAYDKMDKPTFISSLLFTSKISSYQYAFSVFNGIAVLNFTAEVGTSISSGSAITILTSSGYIPSSYRPSYSVGFLANVYNSSSGKWDFISMYVHTNGAMYVRPTEAIAAGDTIRGSVSWTYSSSAWETG